MNNDEKNLYFYTLVQCALMCVNAIRMELASSDTPLLCLVASESWCGSLQCAQRLTMVNRRKNIMGNIAFKIEKEQLEREM